MWRVGSLLLVLLLGCDADQPGADGGRPCPIFPEAIDFGEVEVRTRATETFEVRFPDEVASAPLDPPFGFVVGVDQVQVFFQPLDGRLHFATWRVTRGAGCAEVEVALKGLGSGGLEVSAGEVDFGRVTRNELPTQQFVVTNSRRRAVDAGILVFPVPWLSVSPTSFSLEPSASQTITLSARAVQAGPLEEELNVLDGRGGVIVRVRMEGVVPRIVLSASIGAVVVPTYGASEGVTRSFTVSNDGLAALSVSSIDVFPATGVTLTHDLPPLLSPLGTARVTLTFDTSLPAFTQEHEVRFISNDPEHPDAGRIFQVDRRDIDPCPPDLEFPRSISASGQPSVVLTFTNPAQTSCLVDDVHFEPTTPERYSTANQVLISGGAFKGVLLIVPRSTTSELYFRPLRPGAPFEHVTIDTR